MKKSFQVSYLLTLIFYFVFFAACNNNENDNSGSTQKPNDSSSSSRRLNTLSFRVMKMPADKLKKLYQNSGDTLRRIYFQFQATSNGEYTVLSYAWCKTNETLPARYCDSMFLNPETRSVPIPLSLPLTFTNLEWRKRDIKNFLDEIEKLKIPLSKINILFIPFISNDDQRSVYLIPTYDYPNEKFYENDSLSIEKVNNFVEANAASSEINPCPPKKPDTEK